MLLPRGEWTGSNPPHSGRASPGELIPHNVVRYLVPKNFLADSSDAGSWHELVEDVVPEVAEEPGRETEAEAHVKRPMQVEAGWE